MDVLLGLVVNHPNGLGTFLTRPYTDDADEVLRTVSVVRATDGALILRLPSVDGGADQVSARVADGWEVALELLPEAKQPRVSRS